MRTILRLMRLQRMREASKRQVFIALYLLSIYACYLLAFSNDDILHFLSGVESDMISFFLILFFMITDMMMKFFFKTDVTVMDDFMKSRPISERTWNRVLLCTNLIDVFNYFIPALLLPLLWFMCPSDRFLFSVVFTVAYSLLNGFLMMSYRRGGEWMMRWPLILAWIGLWLVLMPFGFLFTVVSPFVLYALSLLILLLAYRLLLFYMDKIKGYIETESRTGKVRMREGCRVNDLSHLAMWRSTRYRKGLLVLFAMFLYEVYYFGLVGNEANKYFELMVVIGLVALGSVFSGANFSVDGNYFDAIWTKPLDPERLLRRWYYNAIICSGVFLLALLPLVFMSDVRLIDLLVCWIMGALLLNLCFLTTSLFNKRIDLFTSAFFNYQGVNLLSLVIQSSVFVVAGIFGKILLKSYSTLLLVVLLSCSLIGFVLHKRIIRWIANRFKQKRYQLMESYRR